jgi:hypothetical protein
LQTERNPPQLRFVGMTTYPVYLWMQLAEEVLEIPQIKNL